MYSLVTTSGPSVEPITTAEAKVHLRVDHSEEDSLIGTLITAARQQVEAATGLRLVTQTIKLTLCGFPCGGIEIPVEPVQSITSVKYYDTAGVQQTMVADVDYSTWLSHSPPMIYKPLPWSLWPTTQLGRLDVVEVVFVAGYGLAASVPAEAKAAIYLTVGYWFENRGDGRDPAEMGLPPGALRLIRSLSTGSYS